MLLLIVLIALTPACKSSGGGVLAPGQKAPAFELRKLFADEKLGPQDFQGKLVLLTFWASWCAPCLTEMKQFNELYADFREKGLEIVAIGSDDSETALRKTAKDLGVTFTVLFDREGLTKTRYDVSGFPETFIVKPDGTLILFPDPVSGPTLVVKGERPWASADYRALIEKYLPGAIK